MQRPEPSVYLNGAYLPRAHAALPVEDRGTLFGDGVYEVVRYVAGRAFAMDDHLARLRRSLGGIRLAEPETVAALPTISDELVRRNGLSDAKVYWQITRGSGPRDHRLPASPTPSVLAMAYDAPAWEPGPSEAVRVVLQDDARWVHCWIKSLMLLPNVLARDAAARAGADDAILHRAGVVTEATASNVMIVTDGAIHTPPTDGRILAGVTRQHVLHVAGEMGLAVNERPVTCEQLLAADEVFLTGTTINLQPVVAVDDQRIGPGEPGGITRQLAEAFTAHVHASLAR